MKKFKLTWAFESLEDLESFYTKRMFGGLAVYAFGRMVMLLTESKGQKSYRGKRYKFELWNGILYPTDREKHEAILKDFPSLLSHPILGKWLFLKYSDSDFERLALDIAEVIASNDSRFGIYPKAKTKSNVKKTAPKTAAAKKSPRKKDRKGRNPKQKPRLRVSK